MLVRYALLGLFLAAWPAAAYAAEVSGTGFRSGNWHGAAYTGDDGSFSHCAMHTAYNSGIDLHFAIDGQYHWRIGLAHKDWSMKEGETFTARYQIDRRPALEGQGKVVSQRFFMIELAAERDLFDRFRRGSNLEIDAGGQTYSFKLTGTSRALSRLLSCVNANLNRRGSPAPSASNNEPEDRYAKMNLDATIPVRPVTDPSDRFTPSPAFAPPQPPQEAEPPRTAMLDTTRDENPTDGPFDRSSAPDTPPVRSATAAASPQDLLDATRFAIGLFATPDYAAYRLAASVPDDDEFLAGGAVSWTSAETEGVLRVHAASDPGIVIADAVAADSRRCLGSFASGRKPAADNPAILTGFTACTADGASDFYIDYIAFRHASGKVYLMADRRAAAAPGGDATLAGMLRGVAQAMQ